MAYKLRDERPGYHHVITRGNNKRVTYKNDEDRWSFCQTVDRIAKKHDWTIVAYCLMKNHYHLVIGVGDRGLAAGMCELNTAYACGFNARHGRINHLFGKRYWNRRIKTEASMRNAVRYVVQNPKRAGGSRPLEAYPWSSYAATIGLAFPRMKLALDELLPFFGRTPESAVEEFRIFCSAAPLGGHRGWQPPRRDARETPT